VVFIDVVEKQSEGIVGLITTGSQKNVLMYLNRKFEFFEHFLNERKKYSTPFEVNVNQLRSTDSELGCRECKSMFSKSKSSKYCTSW
jgi:hypothetical protein